MWHMRGYVVLSLKQLTGNSCRALENVLCPAVIMSPAVTNKVFFLSIYVYYITFILALEPTVLQVSPCRSDQYYPVTKTVNEQTGKQMALYLHSIVIKQSTRL